MRQTVDALGRKHLVVEKSSSAQPGANTNIDFVTPKMLGTLKFDPHELAIVCELLLRRPQTPGELRSRAARMAPFTDVSEVEATLTRLSDREEGPFVTRLVREPGRRDSRYAHLFSGAVAGGAEADSHRPGDSGEGYGAASSAAAAATRTSIATPETAFPDMRQEQRLSPGEGGAGTGAVG